MADADELDLTELAPLTSGPVDWIIGGMALAAIYGSMLSEVGKLALTPDAPPEVEAPTVYRLSKPFTHHGHIAFVGGRNMDHKVRQEFAETRGSEAAVFMMFVELDEERDVWVTHNCAFSDAISDFTFPSLEEAMAKLLFKFDTIEA